MIFYYSSLNWPKHSHTPQSHATLLSFYRWSRLLKGYLSSFIWLLRTTVFTFRSGHLRRNSSSRVSWSLSRLLPLTLGMCSSKADHSSSQAKRSPSLHIILHEAPGHCTPRTGQPCPILYLPQGPLSLWNRLFVDHSVFFSVDTCMHLGHPQALTSFPMSASES